MYRFSFKDFLFFCKLNDHKFLFLHLVKKFIVCVCCFCLGDKRVKRFNFCAEQSIKSMPLVQKKNPNCSARFVASTITASLRFPGTELVSK